MRRFRIIYPTISIKLREQNHIEHKLHIVALELEGAKLPLCKVTV